MWSRRRFVAFSNIALLSCGTSRLMWGRKQKSKAQDDKDLDLLKPARNGGEYLERVLQRGPVEMLHMGRFVERIFYLDQPIGWEPNPGQEAYPKFTVPRGFVTDLASIPPVLWPVLPSDGEYAYAAILHDFLYWIQPIPREDADHIFKFAMQDFKVSTAKIAAIYDGVRVGGESAWNNNRNLREAGESRVLKEFPTNPVTHWIDWKKDPNHFVP